MAKTKQLRIHGYDANNNPLVFDPTEFATAVEKKSTSQRISVNEVFRKLIKDVYPELADQYMDSIINKMRKWKCGYNGPSETEIIIKIGEILGCNLLKPIISESYLDAESNPYEVKINKLQNTLSINDIQISQDEAIAAKEAYSTILDLICVRQELMHRYFHAGFPFEGATGECIPSNYPSFSNIYYGLRKLRFDLPYEVYVQAVSLAKEIYGFGNADFENYRNEGIVDMTECMEEFERYLLGQGSECDDDCARFFAWFEFANNIAEDYCEMLDEIFSIYLK